MGPNPIVPPIEDKTIIGNCNDDWTLKFNLFFEQNKNKPIKNVKLDYNPSHPECVEKMQNLFETKRIDKKIVLLNPDMPTNDIKLTMSFKAPYQKQKHCGVISFFAINDNKLWGCALNTSLKNSYTFY